MLRSRVHCFRIAAGVLDLDARVGDGVQSPVGIFVEAAAQHPANTGRHVGWQSIPVGLALEDGRQCFGQRVVTERPGARQHFIQDAAEGPDIRARIGAIAARLLRAHVGGRARHGVSVVRHAVGRHRQSKVEHSHRAGGGELDVGRLEIAVNDAFLVRGLERLGDLTRDLERCAERQRAARETLRQRRAVDELHHDGVHARCDFESVNRRDVRMVQSGEHASFALQAHDALRIFRKRSSAKP